jgi:hypothetical protein
MPYYGGIKSQRVSLDNARPFCEVIDLAETGSIEVPLRILLSEKMPQRARNILILLLALPGAQYTEQGHASGSARTFETRFAYLSGYPKGQVEIALRWLVDSEFVLEKRVGATTAYRYRVNPDVLAGLKGRERSDEAEVLDEAA